MPPIRAGLDYRPALLQSAGIGRAVRELSRALATEPTVELHLFGHAFGRARRGDRVPTGAHLHRLPIPGRVQPSLARLGVDAPALCGRAQLFHWTDYVYPPVGAGTPVVLTIHDLAMVADPRFHGAQTGPMLARCRAAADRAAAVVCPTASTAAMVREHLGAAEVRVIPFGCDHVRGTPAPPVREPYIVAVGTVEPRKNHDTLLQAWRRMPAPRPRLVVLGRPGWDNAPTLAALEAACRDEGVVWNRRPSDTEVAAAVAGALVLAYPSRLEGFGFPPLEAMALGTPVLAGDTPALREVLGAAAAFCDPDDPDGMAAALAELLADGQARAGRVAQGYEQAARFTWRACAAAHAALYREVARR